MTIPMPTPAPIEITTKVETPPASPRHFSPTAAMLTSLSTRTGTLKRLSSVASESNSPVALTCHAKRGHAPRLGIDDARRRDAHRQQVAVAAGQLAVDLAHGAGDLLLDRARAAARGLELQLAQRAAVDVDGRHAQARRADVDPHHEARGGIDRERQRRPAAPSRALARRLHELRLHQPLDHGRDRRLGDVGALGDLGPGDRPLAEDRLEDRLLAEFAEQVRARALPR